jgi:hypothetical protein
VDAVEPFGREFLVRLSVGSAAVAVVAGPMEMGEVGTAVRVDPDPSQVRLFPDDGED